MKGHLKKILGIGFGLAIVTGSTIGVGILRVPGSIAALLPSAPAILLCWLLGGGYILLAANAYSELTTMLPKAGGAFNYIGQAFGPFAGFLSGWLDYINNIMAPAYFCLVLGDYLLLLFPRVTISPTLIALGFLTLFTGLHLTGIRNGSRVQKITSAVKIVLFLILIMACFWYGAFHESPHEPGALQQRLLKGSGLIALFKVFQLIMGTYDGWMSVSFFAEENKDPSRTVPRSYFLGAGTVVALYFLINAALLYVLPVPAVSRSPLPVADAAGLVFGHRGAAFITGFSIFSLFSILNAYMMIPARILFGLSRDGWFFPSFAAISRAGTPVAALIFSFVLSGLLIVFSSFDQLFAIGASIMVLVTGLAFLSLIRLRKLEPGSPRPYRAWGYPYSVYGALVVTAILFAGFSLGDPLSSGLLAGLSLLLYGVYSAFIKRRDRNDSQRDAASD